MKALEFQLPASNTGVSAMPLWVLLASFRFISANHNVNAVGAEPQGLSRLVISGAMPSASHQQPNPV